MSFLFNKNRLIYITCYSLIILMFGMEIFSSLKNSFRKLRIMLKEFYLINHSSRNSIGQYVIHSEWESSKWPRSDINHSKSKQWNRSANRSNWINITKIDRKDAQQWSTQPHMAYKLIAHYKLQTTKQLPVFSFSV